MAIYIYIDCHPKTGWTHEILQAEIETQLTLCQLVILVSEGIFYVYLFIYTLSATWSAQFMRTATTFQQMWQQTNYPCRVGGGNIYIYIHICLILGI